MKRITTDAQQKEVRGYIKKWQPVLFLLMWRFDIVYHDDVNEKDIVIKMQPEYRNATIAINVTTLFKNMEKAEREEVIVHEMCHCIVQPLVYIAAEGSNGRNVTQSEIDWHKESVTQHIARALFYK